MFACDGPKGDTSSGGGWSDVNEGSYPPPPVTGQLRQYSLGGELLESYEVDGELAATCFDCRYSFKADFVGVGGSFFATVDVVVAYPYYYTDYKYWSDLQVVYVFRDQDFWGVGYHGYIGSEMFTYFNNWSTHKDGTHSVGNYLYQGHFIIK